MSLDTSTTSHEGVASGVQLAARWSELTGVLALYPDTNVRVTKALHGFHEALRAAARGRSLPFLYGGDLLLVGEARIQVKHGTKVHWLKERFDRAVLSGVQVEPDVPDASLTGFTRVLIETFGRRTRSALGFADVWPAQHEGIELIERRFEGGFGFGSMGSSNPGPALPAPNRTRLSAKLADRIRRDPGVISALRALGSNVARTASTTESAERIDIVEEITSLLPADVVRDEERALEMTRATLEQLGDQQQTREEQLVSLAALVGRGFFARLDAHEEPPEAPAPRSTRTEKRERRPEDDLIEEDLEELERDLERLGPATTSVDRDLVDYGSEQLGVYLHELSWMEDPSELPGLEYGLARLLREPDGARLGILRQFLTADEGIDAHARARLLAYLRRRRATHLIRSAGVLDAEWVLREFPEDFFDYVAMLDLETPEDREALREVCGALGPQRIEDAEQLLRRDTRLGMEAFTRCVFESTSTAFRPFARMLVATGSEAHKSQLSEYLRETASSELDRELIDVVGRSSWLSTEYLSLLAKGDESERLNYQRQAILCRFLRETEGDESVLDRRVRAVRMLVHFPTVAVERILERIVKGRRLFLKFVAPKELRKAARSVLREFAESSLELDDV